ncbi:MAG: hypothetical protein QN122_06770 [Armatimonadota bacterium]|nr:hypothetical protein [Armatimonadota bacterium]MDR7450059.1 hypothetical protein [Armatimonadota bacterium]MDR7460603.1 hypothetical protein [Armatimonadota bacterium]MDR7479113.1 hypothetical protein [Armatimonadota bacterium]MDR7489002.1 hypothetical protein [Armatimonadota bacterium]
MAFIRTVPPEEATGLLRDLYEEDRRRDGAAAHSTQALSLRPEVIAAWRALRDAIRAHMDLRRYELVTIAAARALRCTY